MDRGRKHPRSDYRQRNLGYRSKDGGCQKTPQQGRCQPDLCGTCEVSGLWQGVILQIGTYKDFEGSFVYNYAKNKGKKYCTWHYITYKALYQIVLTDIQLHTALLKKDRAKFEEALQIHLSSQNKTQLASLKKEQNKLQKRFAELGQITKKLYEDNALSRISDEEYARLSVEFINERSQVEERLSTIDEELKKEERNLQKVTSFTAVIEKYLDIKELNKTVLNELIDKLKSTKQKRSTAKESKRLISITDSSAT